jgi:hypothetical protein
LHSAPAHRTDGRKTPEQAPSLPVAAMAVVVVMPVVCCSKANKKCNKIQKLVVCNECFYLLLYIIRRIAIYVTPIVVWPKPKPLWSNLTLAYWVLLPESSKHHQDGHIILLGPERIVGLPLRQTQLRIAIS